MAYDRAWLLSRFLKEPRPALLLFWGHQPSKDGRISASCFSQWWPAPFTAAGVTYATAEHWMMSEKARLFGDEVMAAAIAEAATPKKAKELGRRASGFDDAKWNAHKRRIVLEGNLQKFRQNPPLAEFLAATDDQVLVEASPVDPIWGIGLAAEDASAKNPTDWRGENLLGFILMEVRDRLRDGGASA